MIFSQDKCPLCGKKLQSEFIHLTPTPNSLVSIFYKCATYEIIRNNSNSASVMDYHYTNEVFDSFNSLNPAGQLARMIIPPYIIDHSSNNNMTSVSINRHERGEPQKLIFRAPLLDIDYSQTHIVLAKLKVLVTFS